jgi:hypothetical protein
MKQDLVEIEERKICNDRSANFRGTALVKLEVLEFNNVPRADLVANVKRLKGIFEGEGCHRIKAAHRLSAVIDQQTLDAAIQASPAETSYKTILENPHGIPPELVFPPGCGLRCSQGQSRVQAAKQVLPPGKQSWAVKLFLKSIFSKSQS